MHSPPAVSFPFDRSAAPWRFLWFVLLCAGGVCAVLARQQPDDHTLMILGLAWGLAFAGVIVAWVQAPVGILVWDGSRWHCTAWPHLEVGNVRIAMDFQSRVLVALKPAEGLRIQWVWLSREADPLRWHTLRCALVAASQ